MAVSLPRRRLNAAHAIALVRYLQGNNYKAKISHYRRRVRRRDKLKSRCSINPGDARLDC